MAGPERFELSSPGLESGVLASYHYRPIHFHMAQDLGIEPSMGPYVTGGLTTRCSTLEHALNSVELCSSDCIGSYEFTPAIFNSSWIF